MKKIQTKFGLVLLASAFIVGCGEEQVVETRDPPVRPIKLVTIEEAPNRLTSRFPAVVDAAQTSELSFQVSGLVIDLPVTESQDVKAGDVIAKLNTQTFETEVAKAQAQYSKANDDYQRAVKLNDQNAIAKSVFEERQSTRRVARAALDSAKKALDDTVLIAPFDGAVASLNVEAQQNIQAGSTIATIVDLSSLQATSNIPAAFIAGIENRTDRQAFINLDVQPDLPIKAEFKEADLLADTSSQTYAVTFAFPAPENLIILPGMNATLEVSSSDIAQVETVTRVSVPLAAILDDGSSQYVWLVDGQKMTVSKRQVVVEPGIGETLFITDGLEPGDVIAGAGANYLSEGIQVRPWES